MSQSHHSLLALGMALLLFLPCQRGQAETALLEAESFDSYGGWSLDTQFIRNMESSYLLAHGLGSPARDAVTEITIPETGRYHVFVRTKD